MSELFAVRPVGDEHTVRTWLCLYGSEYDDLQVRVHGARAAGGRELVCS
jgi:hypothetical protein